MRRKTDSTPSTRRRLPPLNSLKAFEAAARLGNIVRAAEELCVTRGAISQQIRLLEDHLGVELFLRDAHRIKLAPAAQSLLPIVTYALDAIAAETGKLRRSKLHGRITVAVAPAFGSKWLLYHLHEFLEAHPGLDVRIETLPTYSRALPPDCDIAIEYGYGSWPEHFVHRLEPSYYAPICSPKLLNAAPAPIRAPADLQHLRLIHDDDGARWQRWLSAASAPMVNPKKGLFLDNFVYAIDAAAAGLGVILADPITTGAHLASGTLVRILDAFYPDAGTYCVVIPKEKRENSLVQAFHAWLVAEPSLVSARNADPSWRTASA